MESGRITTEGNTYYDFVVPEPTTIDVNRWPESDNGPVSDWRFVAPSPLTELNLSENSAMLAADFFDNDRLKMLVDDAIFQHVPVRGEWETEANDNARTAIFEALTPSGHISTVLFEDIAEIANQLCLERLLNGLAQKLPQWERQRRLSEIREEIIIHLLLKAIKAGELPADTMVVTLSDYPDNVTDKQALALGYRAKNQKGFGRATYFKQRADGNWQRHVEQLSRSNSRDGSSSSVIKQLTGAAVAESSSIEILATTILATRQALPDGVVTLEKMRDEVMGEGYLYGNAPEQVTDMHPAYDSIREVSVARELKVANFIGPLALAEQLLDDDFRAGKIDYRQKLRGYHRHIEKAINEICFLQPEYAPEARGQKSAKLFEKAHFEYFVMGNIHAANGNFIDATRNVEAGLAVSCGGGGETIAMQAEAASMDGAAKTEDQTVIYKPGYCRIPSCVSEGELTEVGDCSICRDCARRFDRGELK